MEKEKDNSSYRYFLPERFLKEGDRIALYGAGKVGTELYEQFQFTDKYAIVGWFDKNWEKCQNFDLPVVGPEKILKTEYDKLVIAILDYDIAYEALDFLVSLGVSNDKVIVTSYRKPYFNMDNIYRCIDEYVNPRVVVYGVGNLAREILLRISNIRDVRVADKIYERGVFYNRNICSIDELKPGDVDIIIIATDNWNFEEAYYKICDRTRYCGIKVIGADGTNLDDLYRRVIIPSSVDLECLGLRLENLFEAIDKHDNISFDIFDTILMRKTLFPKDVFYILENKLHKDGIEIKHFAEKRILADFQSEGGNISQIYDLMVLDNVISEELKSTIIDREIELEKKVLTLREDIYKAYKYALASKKKVYFISDMYFDKAIMSEILGEFGIYEYEDILVSCDYGKSKSDGLFGIYMEICGAGSYLHIGDDYSADVRNANENGIDSFQIKKAVELLKYSSIAFLMNSTLSINDRSMLGLIISKAFNSPFALNPDRMININSWRQYGYFCLSGVLSDYISSIVKCLKKTKRYDGILFGARDGYIFNKMYDIYRQNAMDEELLPNGIYFSTSRKLALLASADDKEIFELIKSYLSDSDAETVLKSSLGINDLLERKDGETEEEYFIRHYSIVANNARTIRSNYRKYLKSVGIVENFNYILTDMMSRGTTQAGLQKILNINVHGYYLVAVFTDVLRGISINGLFEMEYGKGYKNMFPQYPFISELFLSSPTATTIGVSSEGKIIFDDECRTKQEIDIMLEAQDGILEFYQDFISNLYIDTQDISLSFVDELFRMSEFADMRILLNESSNMCVHDDFLGRNFNVWTNKQV